MIGGAASLVLAALPAMAAPADGWAGDFADGLARIRSLADEARYEEALEVAAAMLEPGAFRRADREGSGMLRRAASVLERPLAWIGIETIGPRERAEVRYAEGLVAWRAGDEARAEEAFESARSEAGPGRTRRDSIYALGTLELARAERLRAEIPEIAGASPAPTPAASGEGEADPLELAREAYLAARASFVEGLRVDWRHADTRANTELVLRRLRELDEIERERQRQEEEQQEQQQPEPQDSKDEGESSSDEPSDSSERPEDESDADTPPDEGEPTEDPSEEEPDPSEETGEDENGEDEQEPAAPEADAPGEPEERVLTEEEVKRLLERLDELVEKGEDVRARVERVRRVPVERDW